MFRLKNVSLIQILPNQYFSSLGLFNCYPQFQFFKRIQMSVNSNEPIWVTSRPSRLMTQIQICENLCDFMLTLFSFLLLFFFFTRQESSVPYTTCVQLNSHMLFNRCHCKWLLSVFQPAAQLFLRWRRLGCHARGFCQSSVTSDFRDSLSSANKITLRAQQRHGPKPQRHR